MGGASGPDSTVLASTLTWTPTNLTGSSPGGNVIAMRQGDSLLLTATGSGTTLQIDGDGDGIYEHTGAPGDRFPHAYNATGTFVATAKIDGAVVGSLMVKVIAVGLGGPTACEVGFRREKNVVVEPPSEAGNVLFASDDFTPMDVSLKEATSYGATLYLTPLARGTPVLLARVGGAEGPIYAVREVDEFTVDLPARTAVVIDPDTRVGPTILDITPYVSGIEFEFDIFAARSTFTGGATHFTANTSVDFQRFTDPATGEEVGRFFYEIEVPVDENACCFNVSYFQRGVQNKPLVEKPGDPVRVSARFDPNPPTQAVPLPPPPQQAPPVESPPTAGTKPNNNPEVIPRRIHMFLFGWMGPKDCNKQINDDLKVLEDKLFSKLTQLEHGYNRPQPIMYGLLTEAVVKKNQEFVDELLRGPIKKLIVIDIFTTRTDLLRYLGDDRISSICFMGHGTVMRHDFTPPGSANNDGKLGNGPVETHTRAAIGQEASPANDNDPVSVTDWTKALGQRRGGGKGTLDYITIFTCFSGGVGEANPENFVLTQREYELIGIDGSTYTVDDVKKAKTFSALLGYVRELRRIRSTLEIPTSLEPTVSMPGNLNLRSGLPAQHGDLEDQVPMGTMLERILEK